VNSEPIIMQTLWNSCGVCFFAYFLDPLTSPLILVFVHPTLFLKTIRQISTRPLIFSKSRPQTTVYMNIRFIAIYNMLIFSLHSSFRMLHTQRPSKYYTIQFSKVKRHVLAIWNFWNENVGDFRQPFFILASDENKSTFHFYHTFH
jgi:hypothetical protein